MRSTSTFLTLLLIASCSSEKVETTDKDAGFADATTSDSGILPDSGTPDAGTPDLGPPTLPTTVDSARLTTLLQELSADDMQGRLTGAPSGQIAEQYVYDFLESTGIEMMTQDVVFPLFEVTPPIELSILDAQGAVSQSLAYIDDFREVDFSGSGRVTGEMVFASYGIVAGGRDDYAGLDVTGKVVVIFTGIPAGSGLNWEDDGRIDLKVHQAHEHGAAGVILIPTGRDARFDNERSHESEFYALDKYRDYEPSYHHASMPVVFIHQPDVPTLLGQQPSLNQPGFAVGTDVTLEVNGNVLARATCKNIFGVMRGEDPQLKDEVIILGAHYDHLGVGGDGRIFNGAADNATGTAIVLEAAASMMASRMPAKRTVLFALWCGEEQGLRGSYYYGHYGRPLFNLSDTKLMVQVDYIGEVDGPFITNLDDNPLITTFLGDAMNHPETPLNPIDWGGECASDDCVFLAKNVPAYRFIAYGDHHHVTTDTFDNLNLDYVERVGEICVLGLGAIGF